MSSSILPARDYCGLALQELHRSKIFKDFERAGYSVLRLPLIPITSPCSSFPAIL